MMQAPNNTLLAGMMTGNPLLGAGNPLLAAGQAGATAEGLRAVSEENEDAKGDVDCIDPDIRTLCDNFKIEERWVRRLDELMRRREDSKHVDLLKLWEVLDRARSP